MPIINSSSSAAPPVVQATQVEAAPRARRPQPDDAASIPPDNVPPKRSQRPSQGVPAPRARLPSVVLGASGSTHEPQGKQAEQVGARTIHQTQDSHTMEPLPDPSNPEQIFKFAMSFDAYKAYGSFEAAAKIARDAPRSTLEEVRAELFFKARASRHSGNDAYVATFRELLPLLERFSKSGPA